MSINLDKLQSIAILIYYLVIRFVQTFDMKMVKSLSASGKVIDQ
jgi:hypothetical protein